MPRKVTSFCSLTPHCDEYGIPETGAPRYRSTQTCPRIVIVTAGEYTTADANCVHAPRSAIRSHDSTANSSL
eukprot:scaffold3815_cov251-Pinguiococcus_pyrenoidosus.AAC.6